MHGVILKVEKVDRALLQQAADIIRLTRHVYHPEQSVPEGWKMQSVSSPAAMKKTGFFAAFYERENPATGETKYVIAFRGTDGISDLGSDLKIGFGQVPEQYSQALAFVEQVCKEKGIAPAEIELTGHSLGGYLARTAGETLGAKKVWTFNSPGPTRRERDYLARLIPGTSLPNNKLIQVRSTYDVVGEWGYDEGIILEVKTDGNAHSDASLQRGIETALGKPETPVREGLSLSSIFNAVSEKISQSQILRLAIKKLFYYGLPSMGQPKTSFLPANRL